MMVLMPKTLTAENGAKAALSGEFKIQQEVVCSGCHYNEADPECEVCGGEIEYIETVTVPWDTIKDIYNAAVKLLAAPAQLEHDDEARLDFLLDGYRKVVVERLPSSDEADHLELYVEEGFMGEQRYPAVAFTGDWCADPVKAAGVKRDAIDAAMAVHKTNEVPA